MHQIWIITNEFKTVISKYKELLTTNLNGKK
jgi:hypothetical protein